MSQMAYIIIAFLGCVTVIVLAMIMMKKGPTDEHTRSITRLIFISTQVCALIWVFVSYAIALYSTAVLGQVYTMSELSEPAIHTILGVSVLKVIENIFEHNDGFIFGNGKDKDDQAS